MLDLPKNGSEDEDKMFVDSFPLISLIIGLPSCTVFPLLLESKLLKPNSSSNKKKKYAIDRQEWERFSHDFGLDIKVEPVTID